MRRLFVVVSAVVLVGAVVAAAWFLLSDGGQEEAATAAADAFVRAWSEQDWPALDTVATEPAAADTHAGAIDDLEAADVSVTLMDLDLDEVGEGLARARYEATYSLSDLGAWTHDGEFDVVEVEEDWLVDWRPSVLHPDFESDLAFRRTRFWPDRAPIQGPGGADLAGEGEVVVVGIEPQRVEEDGAVIDAIEELTPASGSEAEAILERDDLQPDWFYSVVTMSRPDYDDVRDDLHPVPGLVFQEETDRTGASEATEELIGHIDEITAEQLENLGDPYREGDRVGRTGLEASLERRLAGEPGGSVVLVDEEGEEMATLHEVPATEPEPVELTIDVATQDAAADALEDVEEGGLVAIDAGSGAVRAAVSRPADGFPRAFTGQYAPGSTFKVVTAAALLSSGLEAGDEVECPEEIDAGGRSFRNAGDAALGTVTFTEAFAESCNTAFIGASAELPEDGLAEMAGRFGFGEGDAAAYTVAGRSIPSSFPAPADAAEAAAAAIGQGRVAASPLQMASVAATATAGVRHPPHLLAEEAGDGGEALSEDVAATLRELMQEVVSEGTGTAADVGDVVGKTGTAELADGAEHAWFVGATGDLAFAVFVEEGGAGGEVAAPLAARFAEALGG